MALFQVQVLARFIYIAAATYAWNNGKDIGEETEAIGRLYFRGFRGCLPKNPSALIVSSLNRLSL